MAIPDKLKQIIASKDKVTTMSKLRVQLWKVGRLLSFERNARVHPNEQIEKIAASIKEFGWTNPILVTPEGVIIAGHARMLAALKLEMEEVPVIVLDHLSDEQRRAVTLADNKLALDAGWDEETLRSELAALKVDGFDVFLTGFSDHELTELLDGPVDFNIGVADEDEIPAFKRKSSTVAGDVWFLGDHRLVCGDPLQQIVADEILDGDLSDMVFADASLFCPQGTSMWDMASKGDLLASGVYDPLKQASEAIIASTKGAIYLCIPSPELHLLSQAFVDAGGHRSTFILWLKNRSMSVKSDYRRRYEPILYGWRAGCSHPWYGSRNQNNVWSIDKPECSINYPTAKPVSLVERAIRNSSVVHGTVFDPFGGLGTTLIACEKSGRMARVVESNPIMCDLIVARWENFTGTTAEKRAH